MWTSLGDGYDLIPHDNEKRPRKAKGTRFLPLIIIAIWGILHVSMLIFSYDGQGFWRFAPAVLTLLTAIALMLVFWVKWIKNDREFDISLIVFSIFLLLYASWLSRFPSLHFPV